MRKVREVKYEGGVKLYKCSSCGEFLSKENFAKNIYGYDFISSECRKCSNERMKEYRKQNKEKLNAYQKSYKAKRMMMYEAHQSGVEYIPEPQYPQPAVQPKGLSAHQSQSDGVGGPQLIPAVQPKGLSAHQSQSDGVGEPTYPQPEPIKCTVVTSEKNNDIILTPSINEGEPVITKVPSKGMSATFSNWLSNLEQENINAKEEEKKNMDESILQSVIDKNPDAYTEILGDEVLIDKFNNSWSLDYKISELKRRQEKFDKQKKEKEYNIMKEKMRDLVDATLDDQQKRRFEDKLHSLHEEQQDIFVKRVSILSKQTFPVLREEIFDKLLDNQTGKTSLSV